MKSHEPLQEKEVGRTEPWARWEELDLQPCDGPRQGEHFRRIWAPNRKDLDRMKSFKSLAFCNSYCYSYKIGYWQLSVIGNSDGTATNVWISAYPRRFEEMPHLQLLLILEMLLWQLIANLLVLTILKLCRKKVFCSMCYLKKGNQKLISRKGYLITSKL